VPQTDPVTPPFADSGEQAQAHKIESARASGHLSLQEHKAFKHGRDAPPESQLQYLKPGILAQTLVHHKLVFTFPKDVRKDEADLHIMASNAYSYKKF
jgi:hypothetical protein